MFDKLCKIQPPEGDMIIMQRDSIILAICINFEQEVEIYEHYEYLEASGLSLADLEGVYVIATFGEFRILWMDA